MANLTIADAEQIARRNRPWTIRLEFQGQNFGNQSGQSNKFWYATGRGFQEAVESAWGAIGAKPQTKLITWNELQNKVAEKLAKGYQYAHTAYVRMSAEGLAQCKPVTGAPSSATAPSSGLASVIPPPVPAPPVNILGPSTPVSDAQAQLGEPWSLIRVLKVIREGSKVTGYRALDDQGDELLAFDPTGGLQFAKDYDVEIAWN